MNPYDECVFTKERLKTYKGFERMTDEELDMALHAMYTMVSAYLNNRNKIERYEKRRLREI